jgi:uncharacterized membrane protein YccF (DUF307 family)
VQQKSPEPGAAIIGLPFARVHLNLAVLALWPIGKRIVPQDGPFGLTW